MLLSLPLNYLRYFNFNALLNLRFVSNKRIRSRVIKKVWIDKRSARKFSWSIIFELRTRIVAGLNFNLYINFIKKRFTAKIYGIKKLVLFLSYINSIQIRYVVNFIKNAWILIYSVSKKSFLISFILLLCKYFS